MIRQGSEFKSRTELVQVAELGHVPGDLLPEWVGQIHSMGLGRVCLEVLSLPGKRIHTGALSSAMWDYGEESGEFKRG